MKICSTCNISKPLKDFYKKKSNSDGYDNNCKECKRNYDKAYYAKRYSDTEMVEKRKRLKQDIALRNRKFIYDYLSTHPCVSCGESDPIVLEFDHIDMLDKSFNISDSTDHSIASIKAEIAKCRVLCANCHRRRTAVQLGWYKDVIQ